MTAALHARQRVAEVTVRPRAKRPRWRAWLRGALHAAIAAAAVAGLVLAYHSPANAPLAHPWHYPCTEHLTHLGRIAIEWFTSAGDFMKGLCLQ